MESHPLESTPSDLDRITAEESSIILAQFTADDAFNIGIAIRNRLRDISSLPAVVTITHANSNQLLFHAASRPGVLPANDIMVARKRKTVLRFGVSSWWMYNKMKGDAKAFAETYVLGASAGEYAINGGGVPVRVKGVEGVVAVIVVSGLTQQEDHQVVIEALQNSLNL